MLKKLILVLLFAAPMALLAQAPKKLALDGRKYITELTEEGKKKPLDPDDISFNMGKFKSSLFSDPGWGFSKASTYEITKDSTLADGGKYYAWVGELKNDNDEKLSWSGTISGDDMDGTMEFINKKGLVKKTYTFTGKLKKKAGQK